ncbi:MAG: hypothetical protein ACJ743_09960 [Gaiellaceae bacterium]
MSATAWSVWVSPCSSCGGGNGAGPERGRGWVEIDDYTERRVGSTRTGQVASRHFRVRCDACGGDGVFGNGLRCERCGGEGRREVSPPVAALEPVQAGASDPRLQAMERRSRVGSYDEIRAALTELRGRAPLAHRLVLAVYVYDLAEAKRLSGPVRQRLDLGLVFLDQRMPAEIVVPGAARASERRRGYRRRRSSLGAPAR